MGWDEIVKNWMLAVATAAVGFTTWVITSLFSNRETLAVLKEKVHKIEEDVGKLSHDLNERANDELHKYKSIHDKLDKLLEK